jgi:hypothetical protein
VVEPGDKRRHAPRGGRERRHPGYQITAQEANDLRPAARKLRQPLDVAHHALVNRVAEAAIVGKTLGPSGQRLIVRVEIAARFG